MEGRAVNKVRYSLALLAVLATLLPSTAAMAQHRISFLGSYPAQDSTCDTCTEPGGCDAPDCVSCATACQACGCEGWVHGEYLLWGRDRWTFRHSSRAAQPPRRGARSTGTETLVGGQLLDQMYSGARLRFGLWADPCHQHAWEVDGFYIGEANDRYSFSGTGAAGTTVLARPFFNVLTSTNFPNGREDAELVASPGELSGTVTVEANSRLYGVGIHGMRVFCESSGCDEVAVNCDEHPRPVPAQWLCRVALHGLRGGPAN